MSVKGHLALLVGVFVVALAAVTLIQRSVAGELGAVARDLAGSSAPKARAARELYAAKEDGRDRVVAGPPAGSRPFTPEGQDAARYR